MSKPQKKPIKKPPSKRTTHQESETELAVVRIFNETYHTLGRLQDGIETAIQRISDNKVTSESRIEQHIAITRLVELESKIDALMAYCRVRVPQ